MKLREQLEQIRDEQHKMNITLQRLTDSVEYHVKRSDQADKALSILDKKLEPVENHVQLVNALAKIVITLVTLSAAIAGIIKVFI
jgi:hypothetical protein